MTSESSDAGSLTASPAARVDTTGSTTRVLMGLLLLVAVLVGGTLRLWPLNWDRSQHVHPDERFMVWVADTLDWPEAGLPAALDPKRSPLNPYRWPADAGELSGQPRNFPYGHLPLYLTWGVARAGTAIGEWMGQTTIALPALLQPVQVTARHLAEYNYIGLVGRTLSALFDIGTVLLVALLGRRAYGAAAGLLAATLYASSVLAVQLSHFFTVDIPLTFFVTLSVTLAAHWADGRGKAAADRPGWAIWLGAGVAAGLAVGTKFSAVLLVFPIMAAAWLRDSGEEGGRRPRAVLIRLGAALAAGSVAFALTNPFALLEFRSFATQILAQNAMVSGLMDAPYTRQYIGTLPYLYFVQQLSQWGLGWPLGLAAWTGFAWCGVRAIRRRACVSEWVMLAWAVPYFATTGLFHAKFLRYMAPLMPFLLVMAAGMLLAIRRRMVSRWGRKGAWGWGAALALGVTATIAWLFAFTGIYRQEHPWIQASRWIYQNVPDGSKLLTEHWDDALPLRLDEIPDRPALRSYEQAELPLWEPDTEAKLAMVVDELSSADYIVIASNRLSAPIRRLPSRYPMTSKYYEMLESGDLGYERIAAFSAYPMLGRLVIRDDHADESFTVYDHPRVTIYANRERLSEGLLRSRLGRYLPLHAGSRVAGHARLFLDDGGGDSSLLSQPVESLPVVADFRWNSAASASPWLAVPLWWLAISLFGWLAWPLVLPLLPRLRDRGFGLSRAIGWLLVGWLHWMGVNLGLWQNRAAPVAVLLGLLAVAGALSFWRFRREIRAFLSANWRLIAGEEALFAGAYLAFVGIRLLNPDLWQPWNGGEKFMESAFLNAVLRSANFPPYDPYFSGGVLNYYYYGLYLVSLPVKLTGIAPEVAFNLAIPSLYGLSALGVFSVGVTLGAHLRNGEHGGGNGSSAVPLLAVVLALMLGNLASATQAVSRLASLGGWAGDGGPTQYFAALAQGVSSRLGGGAAIGFDYWAPSRVIPFTINEFPFWTFLFADLHPHLIAIPFGLAAVGLALNMLLASDVPADGETHRRLSCTQYALNISLLVLTVGALGAINTWDLPTYLILVGSALLLAGWRAGNARAILQGLIVALVVGIGAVVAYLPFYRSYEVQVGRGAGWALGRYLGWSPSPSPPADWLQVWGIFIVLAVGFAAWVLVHRSQSRDPTARPRAARLRTGALGWLLGVALVALLLALGRPMAALAAAPLLVALWAALNRNWPAGLAFLALLLAMGLATIAGTELVYLRDFLDGGDWYRMNTVFKFGVPAWVFFGLAGGGIVWLLWQPNTSAPGRSRYLGLRRTGLILLIGAGLLFIPLGVPSRVDDRFPGARPPLGTLDATAYMTEGQYEWPGQGSVIRLRGEREAIRWLLENVSGTPVIAEAPAGGYSVDGQQVGYDYYRAGGLRVASLTGLPTFVGHHQYEQRDGDQVGEQTRLGQEFFFTTDISRTRELMRELQVRYIYIGELERILFSAESLRKFDVLAESGEIEVVFDNGDVRIYHVPDDA